MANVVIQDLVKQFGSVYAVNHVNVEIPEGSLTAILGPSGCGKTTLLRCIAGLAMPDSGQDLHRRARCDQHGTLQAESGHGISTSVDVPTYDHV